MNLNQEQVVLACASIYVGIRFGIGKIFRKYTVHRGMWHSIPAAINVGLICFLITTFQDFGPRIFKASAITIGFLSHLILDEIWSVKSFRVKRSAGTAFKLFTRKRMWPNILTYSILLVLAVTAIFYDPTAKDDFRAANFKTRFNPDWSRLGFSKKQSEPEPAPSKAAPAESESAF